MTDEKTEKRLPPKEEAPVVPERTDVIVRGGASRCPHCHDTVNSEDDAWAACRGCLARHHVACWGEGGQCAACGEKRFVSSAPTRKNAPRATEARMKILVVMIAFLSLGLVVSLRGRPAPPMAPTITAPDPATGIGEQMRAEAGKLNALRGITKRTFTSRADYRVWYKPLARLQTTLPLPDRTLDQFALDVADLVVEGGTLDEPKELVPVLQKVELVMSQDPERVPDLARLRAALKALGAEAPGEKRGITERTFTSKGGHNLLYTAVGETATTSLACPNRTLDEFALVIAREVREGARLTKPELAIQVLEKVESVMSQDPDRVEDLEKIRATLKVLKP